MSSTYRLICLSHNPGLEVVADGHTDWTHPDDAFATLAIGEGPAALHAQCDVAVGRYSYPLIDVACVSRPHPKRHCYHSDPQWIDAGWLRLLWHSRQNDDRTDDLIPRLPASCWPAGRLERLAPLLGIDDLLADAADRRAA